MRRWLGLMAACSLLAMMATGCNHTAGICNSPEGCYNGYGVMSHAPTATVVQTSAVQMPSAESMSKVSE